MKKLILINLLLLLSSNILARSCNEYWSDAIRDAEKAKGESSRSRDLLDKVNLMTSKSDTEFLEGIDLLNLAKKWNKSAIKNFESAIRGWKIIVNDCSSNYSLPAANNRDIDQSSLNLILKRKSEFETKVESIGATLATIGNVTLAREVKSYGYNILSAKHSLHPFYYAAKENNRDYVEYLISLNEDPALEAHMQLHSPLISAIDHVNLGMFHSILRASSSIDQFVTFNDESKANALDFALFAVYDGPNTRALREHYDQQSRRMEMVLTLLRNQLQPEREDMREFISAYIASHRFDTPDNDTIEKAIEVPRMYSTQNNIEKIGDIDFYKLGTSVKTKLAITIQRGRQESASIKLEITNKSGEVVASMSKEVGNETLTFDNTNGEYFVKVTGTGSELTTYNLDIDFARN
ncbi:hypothetical protein A9Q84_13755 [Halobacteriovorax marinus]|uniref:Lipoprotein n=1 Tax=Halobacteriovorax marinus TaxID=97084 RepID=A0A1Y5F9D4_9BACT|nr:hypothetical protein A9Q84_13755 [Halobacteriovorax marinus]